MLQLTRNGVAVPFLVESEAHEGVRRVAGKVMEDVRKVSGAQPEMLTAPTTPVFVLCATQGCSPLADQLTAAGKLSGASQIQGKWECWTIQLVDEPFPGVSKALVILGSDKRGTIYGMYSLSEYIGVSPLWYWGDAEPLRQPDLTIGEDIQTVTREPSVRYRGFFINDEWPCFGTWCMKHFGGVNAEMYDLVFDLLLRLKGNYFWPAMWASVFGEEGPGSANEELADLYGVVVGNSHHEPCLRAGEEFKHSIRDGGKYGTDWNFVRNREGITRFWADGLQRSGKYEHLITIGMRGEADSAMLGEDSDLRANIEYLKDVITVQEELIQQHAGPKSKDQPRLLALYKEVEPFFYGSSAVPGLKDWEGLRDTVCMLCEDNHGFMRSLPTPEMTAVLKARNCGWGMYYHVDYHGGPVSYEWMPSTPFAKLWEQMCLAYDYGVRDVWILNVGDLKGNEVSLKQFLDLAYDYDRWGSHVADNWRLWVAHFVSETFPAMDEENRDATEQLLTDLYDLNGKRRPEALNARVYHPCHHGETANMLWQCDVMLENEEEIRQELTGSPMHSAFCSMVSWPVRASLNLLQMHLYAGLNAHYAAQGRPVANRYADLVERCLTEDGRIGEAFAQWKEGKWQGMEQEAHIGFTTWNEDGCLLPLRTYVTPWKAPRLSVSRQDDTPVFGRKYGPPAVIQVHDFLDEGVFTARLEIANAGVGEMPFTIEGDAPWLTVTPREGVVTDLTVVHLHCLRGRLPYQAQQCILTIRTADATVQVSVRARRHDTLLTPRLAPSYRPVRQVVTIDAANYYRKHDVEGAGFRLLSGYGRSGSAMKLYPSTAFFRPRSDAPSVTYLFTAPADGDCVCELWLTPTSPVRPNSAIHCTLTGPDGTKQVITCVPTDYRAGENSDPRWCHAMVNHIRKVQAVIRCRAGLDVINEITIGAVDPNLSLERILIYPAGHKLPESYLGPAQSPLR